MSFGLRPQLSFTLLADGTSDRALLPILVWLLREHTKYALLPGFAELGGLRDPPQELSDRVEATLRLHPADLLFVHRDAEKASFAQRVREIEAAVSGRAGDRFVPVVPVRMQEAWLLFDEAAIRKASNNPNGRVDLDLPKVAGLERVLDPKARLHEALKVASQLGPRRRRRRSFHRAAHKVAELIRDYSPLRRLPAFADLESRVEQVCREQGWGPAPA